MVEEKFVREEELLCIEEGLDFGHRGATEGGFILG